MRRLRLLVAAAFATSLTLSFSMPQVALAAYNATCDMLQLDNTWLTRNESVPDTGPWITNISGNISYYNYSLCTDPGIPGLRPEQTSSSAWVAIEGPHLGGAMGGNSIVQVGFIKCQNSSGCAISGIDNSHWNRVVYFYAFGNANDLLHQPFPQYIADSDTAAHTFEVNLHYLANGTRQWEFKIDGMIRKTIDDSWRTWNRQRVEAANELWNEGDQLGGRPPNGSDPGNKQKFRNVSWVNNTVHTGISSIVFLTGHCYPWSGSTAYSNAAWDTWTNNNHTDC